MGSLANSKYGKSLNKRFVSLKIPIYKIQHPCLFFPKEKMHTAQLSKSSPAIHRGDYFSASSGLKSIPISAPELYEYRCDLCDFVCLFVSSYFSFGPHLNNAIAVLNGAGAM